MWAYFSAAGVQSMGFSFQLCEFEKNPSLIPVSQRAQADCCEPVWDRSRIVFSVKQLQRKELYGELHDSA